MTDRVLIVGGGVIGCAIARELASDFDVHVFEKGQIAGEATALAAGEVTMLSSYTDEPSIGWHAIDFFRAYDGTREFSFTELPSVELVVPEREGEARRRTERLGTGNGSLPVRFLEAEEAAARYPPFDLSSFAGVVEHGVSGFVDPYTFAVTLKHDAEERSTTFHTETPVSVVEVEDGRVRGIETVDGAYEGEYVVAAAGWRTREFLLEHVEVPIRPYRTQCVVVEPDEPLAEGFPMGWHPGEHVYFRPEHNDDLLVGGWSFAEADPEGASRQEDEAFRHHVAALLPRFLRGFDEAGFVDGWAGVDGATPDTRPIVDKPEDAPGGLVVAAGFHGRGVMTAPVAATAVRSLITNEEAPFPLAPFALDRFDSRSDDFEFHSISAGD